MESLPPETAHSTSSPRGSISHRRQNAATASIPMLSAAGAQNSSRSSFFFFFSSSTQALNL